MTDDERKRAMEELGVALTELRASLDETLAEARAGIDDARLAPVAAGTTLTPNAVPALIDFLRALPRIVGQSISGDDAQVGGARESLAELQQKLATGGIALDERFTGFADRLAGLRRDAQMRRNAATTSSSESDQDADGPPDADLSNSGPSR